MTTNRAINNYREHPIIKEAIEKLSDIPPNNSDVWLDQFRQLKSALEKYSSAKLKLR